MVLAGALLLGGITALVRMTPAAALAPEAGPQGSPGQRPGSAPPAAAEEPGRDVVRVQVEHTLFHPIDGVVLQVERMNGRMVGTPGRTVSLDELDSFSVQIDQAVTRLHARDLSSLINSYLLKQADSAIRSVDVHFDGQQVVVRGQVHKLVTLPFEGRGEISATPEGELRMHMAEFRVAGILHRGFLALFGIRLDTVAQPRHKASFRIEGDDIFTSINDLFPPPRVYGRLTRVHVEGQDLVQVIGIPFDPGAPTDAAHHPIRTIEKELPDPNYIYFTGGRMRFGRVTMDNVDLKLVDQTPEDPFDFSLRHYQQQIQEGYVKVTPSQGLVVYTAKLHEAAGGKAK